MPKTAKTKKSPATKKATKAKGKEKYFYFFGGGKSEGSGTMKDELGGKGAGLAEMTNIGIPVPPGFTITTDACHMYYEVNMKFPASFENEMKTYMGKLEKSMGLKFGDSKKPLLVSVRSGAKFSMPGMMDTVLNLGLNAETLQGFIDMTDDARFAYDNYRRFISMFGNVVLGIDKDLFERIIEKKKMDKNIRQDSSLQVADLEDIVQQSKALIKDKTGEEFPEDPYVQLAMARDAVFRSWNNPRAISYRRLHDLPHNLGTAVNVQAMVYGNMGTTSGTGVGFTRNPATGDNEFYGEYLTNAQGEDVVAGIRTPTPISELEKEMPEVYKQLREITAKLEMHYREVQDFEFTIQEGKLYMLQTRTGKRTIQAALKIATDMVDEGLISEEEAIMRIDPAQLDQMLHPRLDPEAKIEVIASGLAASPGAGSGVAVFTAEDAVKLAGKNMPCILVRQETNPDDIEGMHAAAGILTSRGGMTSHAAVVARGMGKPCVAGAEKIRVNEEKKIFQIGKLIIKEGEAITINGSTGEVIMGKVPTIDPELSGEFAKLMKWADAIRRLGVRTNADTPPDAEQAIKFGAEGIGLCRTEHMFFSDERLPIVQEMILADTTEDRQKALDKLLPFQRDDFKGIFAAMEGFPVTIRTLDPPLHEFLPHRNTVQEKINALNKDDDKYEVKLERLQKMLGRIDELNEMNPMLGHRGCRLGIVYPEITEMQARAIIEAACELAKAGKKVFPEIMIPLVGHVNELKNQKEVVERVARETIDKFGVKVKYLIGTMIEIPRAAVTADEIADVAEFFSFGTNDLTQMGMGFSRDDAGKFLRYYVDNGILPKDPFVSLDISGIGELVRMGVDKGRGVSPDLKVGICGEHGGDPDSIQFCHEIGLNYVSCSPFRVPIARLVAAQATLRDKQALASPKKKATRESVKKAKKATTAKKKTTARKTTAKKATVTAIGDKKKASVKKAAKKKPAKKTTTKSKKK